MIEKDKFCQYINYIHFLIFLVDQDRTQKHIVGIMKLLHTHFPRDENGFSELEHYIFDNNFGKPSLCAEYECPETFYNRLIKNKT